MQCYLCGRGIAGLSQLHFDHVVPLSRGGTHAVDNIRPAHAACNLRKSDKLISELDWVVAA
ncbi:HNH endonuclease [Streptomyces europaeiscabiei]